MIKLLRIDDRLIHGQVAMGWTKFVGADLIIVIDDESATNKMKKMILTLAKPAGVDLLIETEENFKAIFNEIKDRKAMIVAASPIVFNNVSDVLETDKLRKINLGGIRYKEGKERINECISLSEDEKIAINDLKVKGYEFYIKATPTSKEKTY